MKMKDMKKFTETAHKKPVPKDVQEFLKKKEKELNQLKKWTLYTS